ncbi:hypothetical protein V5799_034233, partial [Amblyomma americanum]
MAATCSRRMGRQGELLVYPQILEDRDYDGGIVLVVHDGMTIRLEKSYVLGEDFRVTILNGSDSDSVIHGILSNELRITPLDAAERSSDGTPLHKVFKVEDDSDDDGDDDVDLGTREQDEEHGTS